jgi:tetratricopeptide (TPR) repeat protein
MWEAVENTLTTAASMVVAGDLAGARELLQRSADRRNPTFLAALAGVELRMGDHDAAVSALSSATAVAPDNGRLAALHASALQAANCLDSAAREYERAHRLLPSWTIPVARLAALQVLAGNYGRAKFLAEEVLGTTPGNLNAIAALVEMAAQERGFEAANQLTKRLYPASFTRPFSLPHKPHVVLLKGIGENRLRMNAVGLVLPLDGHLNIEERLSGCATTQVCIDSAGFPNALPAGDVTVNAMADPDQLGEPLERARVLLASAGLRALNGPEAVLRTGRQEVARTLQGIDGLIVPATRVLSARTEEGQLIELGRALQDKEVQLPVLLRPVGSHNGHDVQVVSSELSLRRATFATVGPTYVTEQVKTRGTDGLFRKTRLMAVRGKWFVEHHFVSDDWCVHANGWVHQMERRPFLVHEARAVMSDETFARDKRLATIAARLPLDVFGVDLFRRENGDLVVFEANACMRISTEEQLGQLGGHMRVVIEKIRVAINDMVNDEAGF